MPVLAGFCAAEGPGKPAPHDRAVAQIKAEQNRRQLAGCGFFFGIFRPAMAIGRIGKLESYIGPPSVRVEEK
jgi:hypothetical protein